MGDDEIRDPSRAIGAVALAARALSMGTGEDARVTNQNELVYLEVAVERTILAGFPAAGRSPVHSGLRQLGLDAWPSA